VKVICQPFTFFPMRGISATIFSSPALVARCSPLAAAGSSLPMSKSLPGTMPSFASLATIGASASAGGLSFISSASFLK
jgi:hypothetical protein